MNRGRAAMMAAALVVAAPVVAAHQQKTALTSIVINERTGNIEVAHRVSLHDAEHVAQQWWGAADLADSGEDRALFADYARARFSLEAGDEALALAPVGMEIDGPFLWIYDEAPLPDNLRLTIDNRILRDFAADQSNLVNVEQGEARWSLVFEGAAGPRAVSLAPYKSR